MSREIVNSSVDGSVSTDEMVMELGITVEGRKIPLGFIQNCSLNSKNSGFSVNNSFRILSSDSKAINRGR